MSKKFIKNVEDFFCDHCGEVVKGNGYTNHCPKCLWSKHVDVDPGDRASECGGMMEPIRIEEKGGEHSIVHKCIKCGAEKKNKMAVGDDFEKVIDITGN